MNREGHSLFSHDRLDNARNLLREHFEFAFFCGQIITLIML